jgi:hypothetical protein
MTVVSGGGQIICLLFADNCSLFHRLQWNERALELITDN